MIWGKRFLWDPFLAKCNLIKENVSGSKLSCTFVLSMEMFSIDSSPQFLLYLYLSWSGTRSILNQFNGNPYKVFSKAPFPKVQGSDFDWHPLYLSSTSMVTTLYCRTLICHDRFASCSPAWLNFQSLSRSHHCVSFFDIGLHVFHDFHRVSY